MKTLIGIILFAFISAQAFGQESGIGQDVIKLSKDKWQWMADKNVDTPPAGKQKNQIK